MRQLLLAYRNGFRGKESIVRKSFCIQTFKEQLGLTYRKTFRAFREVSCELFTPISFGNVFNECQLSPLIFVG